MIWTFVAPGLPRPTGGDIARFSLANELARGHGHQVRVVHVPSAQARIGDRGDLPWFDFDPAVERVFASSLDPDLLPAADVLVFSTNLLATALAPDSIADGRRLIETLQRDQARVGLPILLLQGQGVFPSVVEDLAFRLPGPKACVGSRLAQLLADRGVPPDDIVHIPNGLDPGVFHVTRPIDEREARVSMNFDPYPVKRGEEGLAAIQRLHRRLGVPATVFGTVDLDRDLSPAVTFVPSPSQPALAVDVYNQSSMFLQPSRQEGFGMCAVEAMACGCALVTTANGGSDDYAHDGETAVVCGPQPEQMVEALSQLVHDDALRIRIAENGARFVERFRWPLSAERLVRLAADHLGGPDRPPPTDLIDLDPIVAELRSLV